MRILCLIMVGAFLLTIAIAENGDSQRVKDKPQASMVGTRSLSKSMNMPWSLHRSSENSPVFNPSNNIVVTDNIASPAVSVPRYIHREHKTGMPMEGAMILEPMQKHHSTPSWMDWIPDFFNDDDKPSGPGPLIGPINFPGLSRNLYIRHNEPLDDDTNHVVIHVINRERPSYSSASSGLVQLPLGNNQISYYNNNPSQHAESFYTQPVKSPEIALDSAQFPYKLMQENPWKLQAPAPNDKKITDKKSQYPLFDAPTEISNGKFLFSPSQQLSTISTTSKPAGYPQRSIAWSQRYDAQPTVVNGRGQYYGQNAESKGPVMFPASNTTATSTKHEQPYAWHRKYGYQNNTRVDGEDVRTASAILRAKLAEISAANRRQVNRINNAPSRVSRTSDASYKQQKNELSHLGKDFNKVFDKTTTQKSPVYVHKTSAPKNKGFAGLDFVTSEVSPRQARARLPHSNKVNETIRSPVYVHKPSASEDKGALEIVQAPSLNNKINGSTSKKNDDVMQHIMTMTASQRWKNITSNVIDAERTRIKPVNAERRVDIVNDDEELTKETTTPATTTIAATIVTPVSIANGTGKAMTNMKDAVEKMMSSFTQWRYKVVSTNFLKELDSKEEENETKKER